MTSNSSFRRECSVAVSWLPMLSKCRVIQELMESSCGSRTVGWDLSEAILQMPVHAEFGMIALLNLAQIGLLRGA